jgi:peptidoglycan/xylan/chitin deacetylase (PgdA/CDA1 family)
MVKILGVKPKYFRPPYGNYNQNAVNVLKDRGYSKIWLWDVDSGDSLNASPDQQKNTLNGAANSYPQPHLILQHSVQDKTPDVVSDTTPNFQSKGYRMVTVNKCIPGAEDWPYTWVGNYGTRDSSWHC